MDACSHISTKQTFAELGRLIRCPFIAGWLAGIVLARLGADVVLTDLQPNLPLLAENCKANGTFCSSHHI